MAFRATCYICARSFFSQDNRNAQRKHLTCGGICRKALRARRQRERRFRRRQNRLEQQALTETINVWHMPRRKGPWRKSPSSTSKPSRKANGTGKHTTKAGKYWEAKQGFLVRSKRSRR